MKMIDRQPSMARLPATNEAAAIVGGGFDVNRRGDRLDQHSRCVGVDPTALVAR